MTRKQSVALTALIILLMAGIGGLVINLPPASALEPEWGKQTFSSAYVATTTADCEILAAPGSNYSWVLTSMWYGISTVEADGAFQIEDGAGTPIVAISVPTDTVTPGVMVFFGDGIVGGTNKEWQVDFSGSTAEAAFVLNCYRIYNP